MCARANHVRMCVSMRVAATLDHMTPRSTARKSHLCTLMHVNTHSHNWTHSHYCIHTYARAWQNSPGNQSTTRMHNCSHRSLHWFKHALTLTNQKRHRKHVYFVSWSPTNYFKKYWANWRKSNTCIKAIGKQSLKALTKYIIILKTYIYAFLHKFT